MKEKYAPLSGGGERDIIQWLELMDDGLGQIGGHFVPAAKAGVSCSRRK